jgi:hypothetical protein
MFVKPCCDDHAAGRQQHEEIVVRAHNISQGTGRALGDCARRKPFAGKMSCSKSIDIGDDLSRKDAKAERRKEILLETR